MRTDHAFTRTSPAGHGGTEGIGMGTVFCNVLTKPNNFLKIEIFNLFFRKKYFLKNLKNFQKNLRIPQNAQKHQKTMFWGSFKKYFSIIFRFLGVRPPGQGRFSPSRNHLA